VSWWQAIQQYTHAGALWQPASFSAIYAYILKTSIDLN